MDAEFFGLRALGVKTVENRRQFVFGNAGATIFNGDAYKPAFARARQHNFFVRRREGYRIVDQVLEYLTKRPRGPFDAKGFPERLQPDFGSRSGPVAFRLVVI